MLSGVTVCKKCLKNNGKIGKSTINTTAKSILSAAKFRCPYPKCQVTDIAYDNLEKHITEECELRKQLCPLKCGQLVLVSGVGEHIVDECLNQPIACP